VSRAAVALLAAGVLFLAMLAALEIGHRAGVRRLAADPEGARVGLTTVDAAVFALFGLLVAFTFSGAATRLEARRASIVEELNAEPRGCVSSWRARRTVRPSCSRCGSAWRSPPPCSPATAWPAGAVGAGRT
jgi:hypothetical protein